MVPTGLIELYWSYSQQIVKATGKTKNLTLKSYIQKLHVKIKGV